MNRGITVLIQERSTLGGEALEELDDLDNIVSFKEWLEPARP
jgi:hypothetical protein